MLSIQPTMNFAFKTPKFRTGECYCRPTF